MFLLFYLCIILINVIDSIKLNTLKGYLNTSLFRKNVVNIKNYNLLNNKFFRNELSLFKNGFSIWKKKYYNRTLKEKLSIIPVYIITDNNNSPYIFQENNQQVCYLFLCPYNAEEMLNELIKSTIKNNIKIHSINMDKAYDLIKEFVHIKQLNNQTNQNIIYWKLIPSKKQIQNALIYLSFKKKNEFIIPLFYITGFYIKKDNKNIIPLFFDYEDMKETFQKYNSKNIKNYNIKILNLADLLFWENHNYFGFIPSTKSLDYLSKLKKIGIKKSYF